MRASLRFLLVLVLAAAALPPEILAQEKKAPTAFDVPHVGMWGAPGVRARFGETITRLQQRLDRNPNDVDAVTSPSWLTDVTCESTEK